MKRLIVIRHAKSDWGDFNLKDFDRPLNERGHKNAPEMAKRLIEVNIKPDLIISSPALRALTTAKYFAANWDTEPHLFKTDKEVYNASIINLLAVVNQLPNTAHTVCLFGHNPGVTGLLNYLTDDFIANMPTCAVAIIDLPFDDWKMVSGGTGNLVLFDYPKSKQN